MMDLIRIIVVIFITSRSVVRAADEEFPIVSTSYGPVQGLRFTSSWTNKTIYSFRGIPYASPPVGDLRFKDPEPPAKWSSVKNCSTDAQSCWQPELNWVTVSDFSEDCLFVNVYSPQINSKGGLVPVMVWVHGGGFFAGSGSYSECGPDFLVGEGVVVVTMNYRLGALGFLTLGTREAPGNAGMKDQRLALQWVQSEIRQFGGDPAQVTLFGESAGSASVHLQYLSPISKGLFHRVIGESGTALNWAVRDDGPYYGMKLATVLNCNTSDTQLAFQCLLAADVQSIITAQQLVTPPLEDLVKSPTLIYIPCIDKDASDMPFLPDFPVKLIERKQGSFVPFIMGINKDEGSLMLSSATNETINNFTNNLEDFIPLDVRNASTESRLKILKERIRQFYFKDPQTFTQNVTGFVNLHTDVSFGYPTAVTARLLRIRADVYLYHFSYNGGFKEGLASIVKRKFNFSGVGHAEELNYIFVREAVNQTAPEDSAEVNTWRRMVKLWTNFAKYGKPTVESDLELQNVTWSSVGKIRTRFLEIGENLTMMGSDFLGPTVALWDSITPSSSTCLHATYTVAAIAAFWFIAQNNLD